ncbi:cytochrome c biogenesis protein [[Eubacterium] cellulosolvens]
MKKIYPSIVFVANLVALYMIFLWAPPERTLGDSYRVFFIHTPSAWVSYLAFTITFVSSILYLKTRNFKWDLYALSSALLGLLFCIIAIITGAIWAKVAWGVYWNWDPRQTTTLILMLAYLGYVSFRMAITDKEQRARISSVLGILAFVSIPLSYLSTIIWATIHPMPLLPTSKLQIGVVPAILQTFLTSTFAITLLFLWMFYITVKVYRIIETNELRWGM